VITPHGSEQALCCPDPCAYQQSKGLRNGFIRGRARRGRSFRSDYAKMRATRNAWPYRGQIYGPTWRCSMPLRDINLTLQRVTDWASRHNGAGKSTMLAIACRRLHTPPPPPPRTPSPPPPPSPTAADRAPTPDPPLRDPPKPPQPPPTRARPDRQSGPSAPRTSGPDALPQPSQPPAKGCPSSGRISTLFQAPAGSQCRCDRAGNTRHLAELYLGMSRPRSGEQSAHRRFCRPRRLYRAAWRIYSTGMLLRLGFAIASGDRAGDSAFGQGFATGTPVRKQGRSQDA